MGGQGEGPATHQNGLTAQSDEYLSDCVVYPFRWESTPCHTRCADKAGTHGNRVPDRTAGNTWQGARATTPRPDQPVWTPPCRDGQGVGWGDAEEQSGLRTLLAASWCPPRVW